VPLIRGGGGPGCLWLRLQRPYLVRRGEFSVGSASAPLGRTWPVGGGASWNLCGGPGGLLDALSRSECSEDRQLACNLLPARDPL